ncbi:uroporphyrinogen-III synthase [Falsirhodobacter sp. 20TX0035]|uniref:uroporphyrinogen-III synthase n=1 Tax=Falsirhodobacter sp. 20TX0035 TaxID=3022019 RepID=UPI00232F3ED0|nr:uroporphyrinogen-III synthase [Falsirhodobacter sp. 20TX0035]MDB6452739.1 uroporphyrinogen-III synthase [Falsirhodobacter sp. 20TX0035]
MSRQCLPVLLTRPEDGSARFAARLTGHVVLSPLSEPAFLDAPLPPAEGLILTSATAVAALRGARPAPRAWCVGDRTAEAARVAGFDARSAQGDAEALFRLVLDSGETGPLLHPRGRESRGDLARRLTAAGIPTTAVVVYEMTARPLSAEARTLLKGPVVVPLFSPASARRFLTVAKAAHPVFACLSPAVAEVLPPKAVRHVAARPDADAMVELVTLLQRLETAPVQG